MQVLAGAASPHCAFYSGGRPLAPSALPGAPTASSESTARGEKQALQPPAVAVPVVPSEAA